MINTKTGQRELAYVVNIDAIEPIVGSDNCEAAVVGGWKIMTRKGTFKPNDLAIYFEIDSHLDTNKSEFAFLASKHGNVKTQKYTFGGKNPGFFSQGLLMSAEDFGGICYQDGDGQFYLHFGVNSFFKKICDYGEGEFLTQQLGVIYAEPEDNKRKAKINPDAKINSALARHPHIAKKYGRFIKKHKWARKLFLLLFGHKPLPTWPQEVQKTDEERIECRIWTLEDGNKIWVATEKIDGSSSTFHMRRGKGLKKPEYFICSRNVVFDNPKAENKNYYKDTIGNIWVEMSLKYDIEKKLAKLLEDRPTADWVTIQAETFGPGVQKRDYGMKDRELRAFNLKFSDCGRLGTIEMKKTLDTVGIPSVPIISEGMTLPKTIEALRAFVHSAPSAIDGGMKEGIVFRSPDGTDSFKCVDPEFLTKYHG